MRETVKPLGIVIPVYNEGANISRTVEAIEREINTAHTIYIVYDFEGDDTLPPARALKEAGVDIEFVRNPSRGVASAIKTGLREAGGRWLLVSMADLSDDYSVVDSMCALMEKGCDVVCGSRYSKGGRQIGGPLLKKTVSRLVGLSLKYAAGLPTADATNSFKLYSREMLDSIALESDGGFEVGMEIVVKAHFSGMRVCEVPSTWRDRTEGESRFRIMKWAPKYLRWYILAFRCAWFGARP